MENLNQRSISLAKCSSSSSSSSRLFSTFEKRSLMRFATALITSRAILLLINCSYFFVLRRFAVGFGKFYLFGNSGGQSALKTCGTKQQSAMVISSPTQYLPAEVDRTFSTARKPRVVFPSRLSHKFHVLWHVYEHLVAIKDAEGVFPPDNA
ncbi:hypothetical protein GQX74_006249 [Glossina fuscipes]|uniref:Uncharacterized protein n=1 Tax=Glossina palpalis gambiensis TaxID=67801 RepID=A0A1B0BUL3_9MUSC|nr:hypothetical protein GQX74_006249 [Glossina fuscipes]